ncbi:hypothetical protein PBI_CANTARE_19 [Brevibacterium phage Cantare]|uniref:Uncharacterized protein n=1 Tax=Brevibacterium phage Cantare TaxID=2338395 RepID=A0A3G3LYN1_9CAUD|nr:hypothetical protein PQD70_gp019 [Brevibacterium phage Cantare]AYQ99240.1 hypothetical protein PBI_CANTARE_19 [Brevibacterium phage Cantare]
MTAVVVFNPTDVPSRVNGSFIGNGEWAFVEDVNTVSDQIAKGQLVIAQAPADPVQINARAQEAFEKLRAFNTPKESEQTKRRTRNNKSQSTTDTTEGE